MTSSMIKYHLRKLWSIECKLKLFLVKSFLELKTKVRKTREANGLNLQIRFLARKHTDLDWDPKPHSADYIGYEVSARTGN